MRIITFFLSIIFLAGRISAHTLHAQQSGEMLLFEIDGNRYEKRDYTSEGELQSFPVQLRAVGAIPADRGPIC